MSATDKIPKVETVAADPEDDLDDLDDVLSEFDSSKATSPTSTLFPGSSAPPPTANTTGSFGRPRTNTRVDVPPRSIPGSGSHLDPTNEVDEDALTSEFARELAKGMESLMREIASEGGAGSATADHPDGLTEEERAKTLKAAWEAMLVEGMNGNLDDVLGGEAFGGNPPSSGGGGFQDKIKQAMGKLKESETNLQGEGASNTTPNAESLEALFKSLGDLGLDEGGDDSDLAGFLENMMGQLMSKEVLYDPIKELANGFPPYLEKPPKPLSPEDRKRYESQFACVKQVLAVFNRADYSDTNPEHNKQIVDLMSQMQSYGTPPTEVMGSLPPGLNFGDNDDCTIA